MRPLTSARRGFTLMEVIVTIAIIAIVMAGLMTMLNSASWLTKQESGVAAAQGSGRSGIFEVSRILREARVGKLYYGNAVLPYLNNATPGQRLADLAGTGHPIR